MFKFLLTLATPFYKLVYRPKIFGKEKIPKNSPYILACNHYGKIDALVVVMLVGKRVGIMAKKEWFDTKFKSKLFHFLGAIPVDREKADFKSIKTCLGLLKDGKPLVIFPEGTRNKVDNQLQEIRDGVNLLAYKADVPIIPVGMNERFKMFGKNYAVVGDSYKIEREGNKFTSELSEKSNALLREKMQSLVAEAQRLAAEGVKK